MRRLTAWVGGALGAAVAYRWWRRRPEEVAEPLSQAPQEQPDERAEELRARLAESRDSDEPAPAEPAEPSVVEPHEPEEALEDRRRQVHEEGRAALDEMKSDDAGG
jgi:hypothetical protein